LLPLQHTALHQEAAFSLTNVVHQAEVATAMSYCIVNGLIMADAALKQTGLVNQVAALDCDTY